MEEIGISSEEVMAASNVAATRLIRGVKDGRILDHGGASSGRAEGTRYSHTVVGTMAELAVARYLGVAWTPGGEKPTHGDLANQYEVRSTEFKGPAPHFSVYRTDSESIFICVQILWGQRTLHKVGQSNGWDPALARMVGWLVKSPSAMKKEWWNESKRPPCWWIPHNELIPMNELDI
tara:strand:- start:132 stop:665 length:534 start_codon:yes stop_codon:yes gene_type:complete